LVRVATISLMIIRPSRRCAHHRFFNNVGSVNAGERRNQECHRKRRDSRLSWPNAHRSDRL